MSRTGAFLLGALGGLLPILVSLLTIDLAPIIDHPGALSIGNYVGYAIRVLVLIILGGTMALLNNEVKQPFAIVQLGIAAPALVTSFINAAPIKPATTEHASLSIISVAHAQDEPSRPRTMRLAGGLLEDVSAGLTNRLDNLAIQNRMNQSSPASAIPPSPQGVGTFCITAVGRFPESPKPIGSPCNVPTQGGVTHGFVGQ